MKHLAEGWQISGGFHAQTGQPVFVVDGLASNDDYHITRPQITGPLPHVLGPKEMIPYPQSPNAFVYLQPNQIRNVDGTCVPDARPFACVDSVYDQPKNLLPRNYYRGPGGHFEIVALTKTIRFREKVRFQIRADLYNPLNHSSLDMIPGLHSVNQVVANPRDFSGVLVRHSGNPRQILLDAKIIF